jgi:hypothetical protein
MFLAHGLPLHRVKEDQMYPARRYSHTIGYCQQLAITMSDRLVADLVYGPVV